MRGQNMRRPRPGLVGEAGPGRGFGEPSGVGREVPVQHEQRGEALLPVWRPQDVVLGPPYTKSKPTALHR